MSAGIHGDEHNGIRVSQLLYNKLEQMGLSQLQGTSEPTLDTGDISQHTDYCPPPSHHYAHPQPFWKLFGMSTRSFAPEDSMLDN